MRTLAILLLGVAAVAAFDYDNHQRIVGGSVTSINQYPDIVALLRSPGNTGHRQSCGGSIINNRSVLTAAHCTVNNAPARWRSRFGSTNANSGGIIINTAQFINHAQYNPSTTNNDVSIIRLVSPIPFSNVIRQGSFAGSNFNTPDNAVLWVAGWGTTSESGSLSEQLRHVQVWAINQAVCRQRYSGTGRTVTDNMLCSGWLDVGGRDACQGDSGGPVYQNGVIVGVTSWGIGCARSNFPGVNARVSRFASWIQQNQ